jgi:hypothetical protein
VYFRGGKDIKVARMERKGERKGESMFCQVTVASVMTSDFFLSVTAAME